MWFETIRPKSFDTCIDLCRRFTPHFTTSRKQPKFIDNLELFAMEEGGPLCNFIESFNKESIQVKVDNDQMKTYLLRKGLEKGPNSKRLSCLKTPHDFNYLLRRG